ncbi:MAG: hypothetical protein ABIJ09_17580 [Pseudomonadota bacterium]
MTRSRAEWKEIVEGYQQRREGEETLTQVDYCAELGILYGTFKRWRHRIGSPEFRKSHPVLEVKARLKDEGLCTESELSFGGVTVARRPARRLRPVSLTDRDLKLLRELGHDRCCSVALVAQRHFGQHANPERAARTRLERLRDAGLVSLVQQGEPVAYLSTKGAGVIAAPRPRRMHPRHVEHHLATLKAVEAYRAQVEARGGRFVPVELGDGKQVPYLLEVHLQARERALKSRTGTSLGEVYDASPDVCLKVQYPGQPVQSVAIEFFSHNYSNEQIASKLRLQGQFDSVLQVADSAMTARRVERVTGERCGVVGS